MRKDDSVMGESVDEHRPSFVITLCGAFEWGRAHKRQRGSCFDQVEHSKA